MRRTRKTPRKTRVSIFAAGAAIHFRPERHFACKDPERAEFIYHQWRAKIDGDKIARVILHEGNLKHRSFKILSDATTRADAPPKKARCKSIYIHYGTAVIIPADLYRPSEVSPDAPAEIVESWVDGLHAVKFPGYPNVVDYTASEARRMKQIFALA